MCSRKISNVIIAGLFLCTLGLPVLPETPRIDTPLPSAKASVFQLAALIQLPFAVTANLFGEDTVPVPGYGHPAPGKAERDNTAGGKDGREDRDQGYYFSNQGKAAGFDLRTGDDGSTFASAAKFLRRGAGTAPSNTLFLRQGFKFLFLLICLLPLLKSTLPWGMRTICV